MLDFSAIDILKKKVSQWSTVYLGIYSGGKYIFFQNLQLHTVFNSMNEIAKLVIQMKI